jgi:F-type H+-transporting ATPase subunit a
MKVRAFLSGVRGLFTSSLVAFVLLFALLQLPLWPRDLQAQHDQKPSPTGEAKRGNEQPPKEDKEPSPLEHVMDSNHWKLFESFGQHEIPLPGPFKLFGKEYYITKFMLLEVISALLIVAIYVPLARKMQQGQVVRGPFLNFFEVLLTFVRDQIAKPGLGEHDADRFVPFLWTMFLFILFNNLLGMVPFGGSPTASLFVTAALALIVFAVMHGAGIRKMGFAPYMTSLWPHFEVPFVIGLFIRPLIFVIEWVSVLVRNMVLAVRLFANMFAGHMVLATLLLFIYMARNTPVLVWGGVTVSSVAGIIALSLLELFIGFLQAFIFTFLTAIFMGMALHPEH